jgi:uncharacterized membrane protein
MTTAFEEFLSHINRRILALETELKRLQDLRNGFVAAGAVSAAKDPASAEKAKSHPRSTRKVA